jgi:DnaK suppressor protein
MQKKKMTKLRESLLAERHAILQQHLSTKSAVTIPLEISTGDAADAAGANDVKEMALNLQETEKRSLARIDEALARIEEGTYGQCDECGGTIPEKRMLAMPQAKYCVSCQEKLEQERF